MMPNLSTYEDHATIFKWVSHAHRVVVFNHAFYHYRQIRGSSLHSSNPEKGNHFLQAIKERYHYIADKKLVELGLTPDEEAYKSNYYTYIMNGMMTQNVRIKFGDNIEEAHMRNRALIANWCYEHSDGVIEVVERDGKRYIKINDYPALRQLFARLLAEIQRIKSEGDYEAAQHLVETYAVKINPDLHKEVLSRYEKLNIAPYKGFLNPKMTPVYGSDGEITDVMLDFSESYTEQVLRYSRDYSVEDLII
jgi:dipeptidyl-peptidase-3